MPFKIDTIVKIIKRVDKWGPQRRIWVSESPLHHYLMDRWIGKLAQIKAYDRDNGDYYCIPYGWETDNASYFTPIDVEKHGWFFPEESLEPIIIKPNVKCPYCHAPAYMTPEHLFCSKSCLKSMAERTIGK